VIRGSKKAWEYHTSQPDRKKILANTTKTHDNNTHRVEREIAVLFGAGDEVKRSGYGACAPPI
jgi:hypothetical protein